MSRAEWAERRGRRLLKECRWTRASAVLRWGLRAGDEPRLRSLAGQACWWLDRLEEARAERERAYRLFTERNDPCAAAQEAMWLAREHIFASAAGSVAEGWFQNAERAVATCGDEVARLWLPALRLSVGMQPGDALDAAEALETATRKAGDPDLHAFALAQLGLNEVGRSRVEPGLRHLEAAAAAALGGDVKERYVASEILCTVLFGCDIARDYRRALEWIAHSEEIGRARGGTFLAAVCRVTRATILTAAGDWAGAETDLEEAKRLFESSHHALRVPAVARLADLRVRQGRLEAAAELLSGIEHHHAAVIPRARLALATGSAGTAIELLEQSLAPEPALGDAAALQLLVEALLAAGRSDLAAARAEQLVALGRASGSSEVEVDGLRAQAAVVGAGDVDAGQALLRAALAKVWRHERSPALPALHLQLASLLADSDEQVAAAHARSALAGFAALGATRERDEAASLLRRLGRPTRLVAESADGLSGREREVWELIALGLSNPEIADRMFISRKTVERHVTTLLSKLQLRNRAEAAARFNK